MLQAFIEWANWWISNQNNIDFAIFAIADIVAIIVVTALSSWHYEKVIQEFHTFWGALFIVLCLTTGVVGLATMLLPMIIVLTILVVVVYGLHLLFYNWGNKYRQVIKMQEKTRLTALASLIESDPTIRAAYDKLMKESEL